MRNSLSILIVEDDVFFTEVLKDFLLSRGFEVEVCLSGECAQEMLRSLDFDVAIIDQKLPDIEGVELARWMKEVLPATKIILITAYPDVRKAVKAMKIGVFDYLIKPFEKEELLYVLKKIKDYKEFETIKEFQNYKILEEFPEEALIGNSEAIKRVRKFVLVAASSPTTPVLIRGETGTGKTLLAKAIHYSSPLKNKPFVTINCAAIPESLLESELFGYEKGAFTGALKTKKGLLEIAGDGTVFLDEIGDMSLHMQAKLLQVLDSRTFRRVGGEREISVKARFICATNKDLETMMERGQFRKDLYYRIAVLQFHLPPLRERKEDIIPLSQFFLHKLLGRKEITFSEEERKLLLDYDYPGNVRELRNIIERALILGEGKTLGLRAVFGEKSFSGKKEEPEIEGEVVSLEEIEKTYILKVLKKCHWNKSKAARLLKISLSTLKRKLKKWGVMNHGSF